MTELPLGWANASVRELAGPTGLVTDGDWVESKDQDPEGSIRLTQLADIGDGQFLDKSARFMNSATAERLRCTFLAEGDVLIARMPDPLGRACIFPGAERPAVTAVDVFIWRPDHLGADARWLMHFINAPEVRQRIQEQAGGTTRQRIAGGKLKELILPVPPLAEQERIVKKLDRLISRTKRARIGLGRIFVLVAHYKQAILAAAFSGELTREWAVRTEGNVTRWDDVSLEEVADIGTGATPKRGERRFYAGGTIPWITSAAVNAEQIDHAEELITEAALRETNCKVFPPGTLVLAMYGEGQTRGRVSILRIAAATNQALAAIRVRDSERLSTDFVLWFLRGNYLELRRRAAGGVQPNLNLGIIKALRIPVPPPREQDEIVRRLAAAFTWLDRVAAEQATASRLALRLDRAVLAKAFRGELVPQDPNDEPATILLGRIRAELATPPKSKRSRQKREKTAQPKRPTMPKSRADSDVKGKPYLTNRLRELGGKTSVEELYGAADLTLVDFYKQLSEEFDRDWVRKAGEMVEAA